MREGPEANREHAEWIAVRILGAIAGDEARLRWFLTRTGYRPQTIRASAEDPAFLAAVVDYVAEHEVVLEVILTETGLHANDIAMSRYALRELPEAKEQRVAKLPMPPRRYA